jgi:methionyl aminopeptidase
VSIHIKTSDEIECMRASCRAAREILEEVSLAVVPGVSTGEIDRLAARLISQKGGRSPFLHYRGFPGHICISVNDEIVHGIGGARRIQYSDIVKLDIGIILRGWVGDTATTIPVGVISPEVTRLLDKTQEALAVGIEQARAGNRVYNISEAIEHYVVSNG